MFDVHGLLSRARRDRTTETSEPRPVNYMVKKDGKPFALLNATPALAKRTVTGFMLATPEASWSYQPA